MRFRHLRARIRSIVHLPTRAEHYIGLSDNVLPCVSLENPIFGSTILEHCIKSELPRVIELIKQSVVCTADGDRLIRKFPTPYIIRGELVSIDRNIHSVICSKAIDTESCIEYRYMQPRFCFSSLVFDRDEFKKFEKTIGASFLAKPITQIQAPATIYTKTIIRLDGKHRKQQMHDAEMVARYVYRLATITDGVTKTLEDYHREITGGSYSVSTAAAAASWSGLPSEIKYRHRPARNKKTAPEKY